MTRVLLATVRLLEFLEGAGHFWAYMQYAQALRRLGCDVYVLAARSGPSFADERRLREFLDPMERYGLRDKGMFAGKGNGIGAAELTLLLDDVDLCSTSTMTSTRTLSRRFGGARCRHRPGPLEFWIELWVDLSGG